MKKLTWILVLLLVCTCLCLPVHAREPLTPIGFAQLELSEDYRTVRWNEKEYQRIDSSGMTLEADYEDFDILLTAEQRQTLKEISVVVYNDLAVLRLNIYFAEGGKMTGYYLRTDLMDTYNAIKAGKAEECLVDFEYPADNTVKTSKTQLMGRKCTLHEDILIWCDDYPVKFYLAGDELMLTAGAILYREDQFYYVDCAENQLDGDFYPADHTALSGWEITDPQLISQFTEALDAFYSDDFGIFFDDSLAVAISKVLVTVVFCVLPIGLFVLFLILSLRAKTEVYRKLFRIVWILAAATAVIAGVALAVLW